MSSFLNNMSYITPAILACYKWCRLKNIPDDHGVEHYITVMDNAVSALGDFTNKTCSINDVEKLCVVLAALLHDLDDRKYAPSDNYEGARKVLDTIGFSSYYPEEYTEIIIKMISLVSCSKNGNNVDKKLPKWMYIPRDADRIEAIGKIGIKRAHDTTVEYFRRKNIYPFFFTDKTPRCTTIEEINKIAPIERLENYIKAEGSSESLVDHMYDKVLHIHRMSSGSTILQLIADLRHQSIVDFVLEFGKTGDIDWSKWL